MDATQKFSCRNLVGPSLSRPTLFCFGLVWSNQTAGKMYPEMDIRRTGDNWQYYGLTTKNSLYKFFKYCYLGLSCLACVYDRKQRSLVGDQ